MSVTKIYKYKMGYRVAPIVGLCGAIYLVAMSVYIHRLESISDYVVTAAAIGVLLSSIISLWIYSDLKICCDGVSCVIFGFNWKTLRWNQVESFTRYEHVSVTPNLIVYSLKSQKISRSTTALFSSYLRTISFTNRLPRFLEASKMIEQYLAQTGISLKVDS